MRRFSFYLLPILLLPLLVSAQAPSKPAATATAPSEDDRIYDEVRRKLADDADVRGGGLDVNVKNGAVILQGRVRDNKARDKATRVAKKVKGVTTVDNKLKLFSDN
jgi:hyperosmotically inducible periplasmic protein